MKSFPVCRQVKPSKIGAMILSALNVILGEQVLRPHLRVAQTLSFVVELQMPQSQWEQQCGGMAGRERHTFRNLLEP